MKNKMPRIREPHVLASKLLSQTAMDNLTKLSKHLNTGVEVAQYENKNWDSYINSKCNPVSYDRLTDGMDLALIKRNAFAFCYDLRNSLVSVTGEQPDFWDAENVLDTYFDFSCLLEDYRTWVYDFICYPGWDGLGPGPVAAAMRINYFLEHGLPTKAKDLIYQTPKYNFMEYGSDFLDHDVVGGLQNIFKLEFNYLGEAWVDRWEYFSDNVPPVAPPCAPEQPPEPKVYPKVGIFHEDDEDDWDDRINNNEPIVEFLIPSAAPANIEITLRLSLSERDNMGELYSEAEEILEEYAERFNTSFGEVLYVHRVFNIPEYFLAYSQEGKAYIDNQKIEYVMPLDFGGNYWVDGNSDAKLDLLEAEVMAQDQFMLENLDRDYIGCYKSAYDFVTDGVLDQSLVVQLENLELMQYIDVETYFNVHLASQYKIAGDDLYFTHR